MYWHDGSFEGFQAQLQERYAALLQALERGSDLDIVPFLAPEFECWDVLAETRVNYAALWGPAANDHTPSEGLKRVPQPPAPHRREVELLSAELVEHIAVASSRYQDNYKAMHANSAELDITIVTWSSDTWTQHDGVWLIQTSETNCAEEWVNGYLSYRRERLRFE
jgi:hypothetical protein